MTRATPTDAAIDRHPHLAADLPDGWVRVDLHSHTMWSGDSTTTPDEMHEAVAETAIDVLCVTDHNAIKGAVNLADSLPCRVVVGEELRTGRGEIIGLFLNERLPFGLSAAEAAIETRRQGGVTYIPHPFDPMRNNLHPSVIDELVAAGLVDAIECLNGKTSLTSLNRQAADYADRHDLARGAGSDAHVPDAIGACFVEMPDFDSPASFLDSLRRGRTVGHHYDAARRWRPRIVPSTSD